MIALGRRGRRSCDNASMDNALLTEVEFEVLDAVRAIISCARKDCITGSRYANVFPDPVAAANASYAQEEWMKIAAV